MRFRRTVLSTSILAAMATLSACGGGGGGGGSGGIYNSPNPIVRPDVPFYTPVRVGSVTPVASAELEYDSSALYAKSLSGSIEQEVIIAGRQQPDVGTYHNYNLSIFGWQNGQLINTTSQWFSGNDNQIIGTEPSIKFGDFNGDGKVDMFVAANTDTNVIGPSAVFTNNGSNFIRSDLPNPNNIQAHDSAVYDMNQDGYDDILTLSIRTDSMISFGGAGGFTHYSNISSVGKGSGVAVADFMSDGSSTFIITDATGGGNRLYSWAITNQLGEPNLYFNEISTLPTPRFLLPKWASYGFTSNHDVRALAFDFDNSGRTSAVIISRPELNGTYPQYSEVQFLKNQGGGVFVDVTDTTLVGYNHNSHASYSPQLMDVNGDGLVDIVLSSPNWTSNSGSQVLVHTSEHKYVASYATVLQAFQDQALDIERAINTNAQYGANGIVFVQGPNGDMYLATAVSYFQNNVQQKAVYLSKLGADISNAQATASAVKQIWPWMSDAQVNTVLAQSSTTWFGLNVLDSQKALTPVGTLGIPVNGRLQSLGGYIGGINLNGAANSIKAIDSVGRDFNINYSVTNVNGINMWSQFVDNIDDDTRGAQIGGMPIYHFNGMKFGGTSDNRNMVVGVTNVGIGKDLSLSMQYTRLPFSPFVQINGAWGLVKSSDSMETTLTHRKGQFVDKIGLMYSTTDIDKGLVNHINPITSVWAETGWEGEKFKVYGGILPKVVAGSASLTLPTGIDNRGRIMYSNIQANIYSPTVEYARFSYNERINKNVGFRVNGMITTQQQKTVMAEFRIKF